MDLHYNHFRFDLRQEIDGSEFVFIVPGDDQVLIPILPDARPFPSDTPLLTGGLSHQFSERTDGDVQLGYRFLDYERPGTSSGGADLFASVRLGHTFNTKTDVSRAYTFRRNEVFDPVITPTPFSAA